MKHAAGALTSDRQQQAFLNAATEQGQPIAKPDGRNAIAAALAGAAFVKLVFACCTVMCKNSISAHLK